MADFEPWAPKGWKMFFLSMVMLYIIGKLLKSGTIFTKEPLAKNEVERTYRSFKTEEEGKECKYD